MVGRGSRKSGEGWGRKINAASKAKNHLMLEGAKVFCTT